MSDLNTLFNKLSTVTVATKDNVRTPMTAEAVEALKKKLRAEMCINVYPNRFDTKKPYAVSTKFNQEYSNHGTFSNLEVAKLVGNVCSLALFGDKALASNILDLDATQQHPEMVSWLEDTRNQDIILRASS